jgi:hypothetical protein
MQQAHFEAMCMREWLVHGIPRFIEVMHRGIAVILRGVAPTIRFSLCFRGISPRFNRSAARCDGNARVLGHGLVRWSALPLLATDRPKANHHYFLTGVINPHP